MNRFVLKNTFIKYIYIYHFLINIFREIRSQSCVLETVAVLNVNYFEDGEGVYAIHDAHYVQVYIYIYTHSSPIRFNFQPITVQSIYQVERDISHSEGIHGKNYRDVSHPFNHSSLHQPLQPRFVLSCIFVVSGKHGYISI